MRVVLLLLLAVPAAGQQQELEALLRRGDFKTAAAVFEAWDDIDDAKRASVVVGVEAYRSALRDVVALRMRQNAVSPAFRWAQNASLLFVEVKFAHTLSAPSKTDAVVDSVDVGPHSLRISAASPQGPRWELVLDRLWGHVETATHSEPSAGRLSLTLRKAPDSVLRWPRLVACGLPTPPNSALWLDMAEAVGTSDDVDDDDCSALEDAPRPLTQAADPPLQAARPEGRESSADKKRRARIKALKKKASAMRRAVVDDVARRKTAVEADARALIFRVREDHDARALFLDVPPSWARHLPLRLAVRDGIWDLVLAVAAARRTGPDSPRCVPSTERALVFDDPGTAVCPPPFVEPS